MKKKSIFVCAGLFFLPWLLQAEVLIAPSDRYDLQWWNERFQSHQGIPPYISELGFRALADHVIDPTHREFDPSQVMTGDSIYVGVWYLDWFVENVHDKIKNPYILITCDVDSYIPRPSKNHCILLFDPKVACWFAKNMLFTNHSKLFQVPMGQTIYPWARVFAEQQPKLDRLVASGPHLKEFLLYLNYTERDHGRRISVADKFWDKPYCLNRNRPPRKMSSYERYMELTLEAYWGEVARSKFVLSPLGYEVDCTRTWECFVLGSIPVIEHSYLDPLYEGLPVLLIHDWAEITEDFLNEKYEVINSRPHHMEKAWMSYWANLLDEKQKSIRIGYSDPAKIETGNFSDEDLATFKSILEEYDKQATTLIYRGNLTGLRPFQIAKDIGKLASILLYDVWTKEGMSSLRRFCKDPQILNMKRVTVCAIPETWTTPRRRGQSYFTEHSYFVDLTHHRHSLFTSGSSMQLGDFCHNLEKSLLYMYDELREGELLFGNMQKDDYVHEVLDRLQRHANIQMQVNGNFWFCIKSEG